MWCQTIRKFLLKFILIICHSEYQRVFYLFIFKWTQSQAKQHTTAHPLLFGEMTEKSGRPKARKLVGQDKNSLITEGNRNKKPIIQRQSPTVSHKQTNAQPVSEQLLPPQNPSSLSFYYWGWHYRASNIPLINLGQLCPFPTCCSSQPTCYEGRVGTKTALTLCKYCSAKSTTLFCIYCFSLQNQNPTQYGLLWTKLILSHSDSVQHFSRKWKISTLY